MRDIDKLCWTFSEIGIEHTRRRSGDYEYVFIGDCRNLHNPDLDYSTSDLNHLLAYERFFEFENGRLASY